jgi:hypothetical protein
MGGYPEISSKTSLNNHNLFAKSLTVWTPLPMANHLIYVIISDSTQIATQYAHASCESAFRMILCHAPDQREYLHSLLISSLGNTCRSSLNLPASPYLPQEP